MGDKRISLAAFMDHTVHSSGPEEFVDNCRGYVCVTPDGRIDMDVLGKDPCLADPQKSAWKHAFVWRLIGKYGDQAVVLAETDVDAIEMGFDFDTKDKD